MKRLALVAACALIAVPLRAEPPAGPGPKLAIAVIDKKGDIVIEDAVAETALETQTRTIEENGIKKTVTVAVPVIRMRTISTRYAAKSVAAFDLDGREMLPSRLASLLRE